MRETRAVAEASNLRGMHRILHTQSGIPSQERMQINLMTTYEEYYRLTLTV